MSTPYKVCPACQRQAELAARYCSQCGHVFRTEFAGPDQTQAVGAVPAASLGAGVDSGKRIAAGLCGILLNCLGIHKFILGYTKEGLIMLLVSLLTCGIGAVPMTVIGFIEGILYLTKSDEEFHRTYVLGHKGWF